MSMSVEYPNLEQFLPDTLIQSDLAKLLWEEKEEYCEIELAKGIITVPYNVPLEVISKSYRQNIYEEVGFGNYYVAQVAIGGVKKQESGILYPVYCFATLFYTPDKALITNDVHSDMR